MSSPEFCYTSECWFTGTPAEEQNDSTRGLCVVMQDMIVGAGASSLLEASPCPLKVLGLLQHQDTDTVSQALKKIEIRDKLGIEAIFPTSDSTDD